jgi:hypothetical protein
MRTFRALAGLALIWSGAVLWQERQRRRRSRELSLVVRAAAASPPAPTVDGSAVSGSTDAPHLDELLVLLARTETPRPPVTLRLRWRDAQAAADADAARPVVRQVRRGTGATMEAPAAQQTR